MQLSPRPTTCSGTPAGTSRRIAEIFRTWNSGRLDPYLIEITADVPRAHDAKTGRPFVDIVHDQAEQKDTGRWTVQIALDLGVRSTGSPRRPSPGLGFRTTDLRLAPRGLAGPGREAVSTRGIADKVEQALYASKIVSYAEGWT